MVSSKMEMNEEDTRYLRRCVRYELGLRSTRPSYEDMPSITKSRAKWLREFAKTFVQQNY